MTVAPHGANWCLHRRNRVPNHIIHTHIMHDRCRFYKLLHSKFRVRISKGTNRFSKSNHPGQFIFLQQKKKYIYIFMIIIITNDTEKKNTSRLYPVKSRSIRGTDQKYEVDIFSLVLFLFEFLIILNCAQRWKIKFSETLQNNW